MTGMAAMVVQFGLAMMPLGGFLTSCGFTSETTSGTSGSLRKAEELSTTIAPASAKRGECSREVPPPAENSAMSMPRRSSVAVAATSSMTICSPRNSSSLPAEREEAKNRTLSAGKFRSTRMSRITRPTWPVAPTTAMVVIRGSTSSICLSCCFSVPSQRTRWLPSRRPAGSGRGWRARPCPRRCRGSARRCESRRC